MLKNKFWFTIIELIVAISILSIISFLTINSFNNNFEKQSLKEELNFFTQTLEDLDKSLWKENTDYEVYISTWWIYQYTTNKNYKTVTQSWVFNWYTWTIKRIPSISYTTEILLNWKNIYETWSNNFTYNFFEKWDYEIISWSWWNMLNNLYVSHYSKINLNNNIVLNQILGGTWNTYTWIIIKNNNWQKRQFLTNTWQLIDENIKLFFSNNLNEITLELIK